FSMESSLSLRDIVLVETFLSLLSTLPNLLFLFIITRYSVFHEHLRFLSFQCHLFLLFSNLFVFIRGSAYLLHSSSSSVQELNRFNCPSGSTPTFFIGLFLVVAIAIGVERSYATLKYDIYELWIRRKALTKGIATFWFLFICFFIFSSLSFSINPIPCISLRSFSSPINDANLPILIFGIFFLSFIPIFYTNAKKNEETLKEYLKEYRSLTSRYQLQENITTSRRFLMQNGVLTLLCLSMLIGSSLMTNGTILYWEIQYLFYPLAGLIISLNFIVFHASVRRNVWRMKDDLYTNWVKSIHWRKEAEVPLLPT
ncbi:hypothetical protein PRIPAC_82295, partial [Pristionchus pacificus]